jgi:hypothetical protein
MSHCHTARPGGSRTCRWWILLDVTDASTGIACAVRRSIYLQSGFSSVSPDSRCCSVSPGIPNTQILWRLQKFCRQKRQQDDTRVGQYESEQKSFWTNFSSYELNESSKSGTFTTIFFPLNSSWTALGIWISHYPLTARTRSVCSPTLVHGLSPTCSERVRIVLTACMEIEFLEHFGKIIL